MSPPYESSRRRRGAWSHWVPLVVTVTVATVGLAAWILSQRKDEEEAAYKDLDYENSDHDENGPYGASRDAGADPKAAPPTFGGSQSRSAPDYTAAEPSSSGWAALRRTPSPQQFFDTARRTVAAGMTAAGVAVGSALAAIREEDKTAYADHETWSEEADAKKDRAAAEVAEAVAAVSTAPAPPQSKDASKRRKKVAIVVSADTRLDSFDTDGFHEHASILSHIPSQLDHSKIKLYVLIYAPGMKDTALDTSTNLPPPSLSSSFSNIDHAQALTSEDARSPLVSASSSDPVYNAIYSQAQSLVEKDSLILTYTSPNGHAHILRHIQPEIVYLQESLAGENGSVVSALQTWMRHDVILVVGAESGHGGLADSESESEKPGKEKELWWHREDRVGRGRGVVVVDGVKVQDDWARRVLGRE
ncbi:hypothetical protein VTJ49DRAFT_584 [Mycothermus thermophilus]|uniref:Peroxin 22-like protein n=1 Tax=Humicola insolens TaxID=85995 RepID=A0ABR3VF96_HUMIN